MPFVIHHGLDFWQLYLAGSRKSDEQTFLMKSSLCERKESVSGSQIDQYELRHEKRVSLLLRNTCFDQYIIFSQCLKIDINSILF